jgi:hypothetical protein
VRLWQGWLGCRRIDSECGATHAVAMEFFFFFLKKVEFRYATPPQRSGHFFLKR